LFALIINTSRASLTLLVLVPFEVLDATNCVIQGIFRGAGLQNIAARINAVSFYVIGLPIGAFFAFVLQWGVEGLWIGFASGILTALVSAMVFLYHSSWQVLAENAQKRTNE
jgi:MATE family multidrug resistance protein